jgi:hypothetical protein
MGWVALLAMTGCAATQAQVVPQQEEGVYVDPWGTPVAWSTVPAASSASTPAPASAEAEEAKPKADDEATTTTTATAEPDTPATTSDLGGDDDDE